ncbi:alpha/beta hydrolase [Rhodococcus sp. IEGM 1307]|uniref:alpha/beta fold hydrolase n=1 Tax=Rhodococcus sp. IEGM 1307 TaxID=3047091 RepID=UPI0024B7E018|nr:alpha/beta hydrolase [Rhodococcus sp. IEGM 1307]MDI9972266.1 alpha/beta hydrolase [Rhodococcus sp. IEGM 1307]
MPRVHVGPEDRVIRLRDGRLMGFAEYGDPGGFTVVNAHGGLAGRLDVAAADRSARDAGIRLLSPDRPGIGLSDPQPGRKVLDWARDVEDLANHLGVGRFGVMGWSMGGQYALAVGSRVASRVTSVAVIAGALPLTESGVFAQLPAGDRAFTRLSQHAPLVARSCFRVMGAVALRAPRLFRRLGARDLGAADAAVLRSEPVRNFSLMSGEALRTAPGMVEDYRAWMRPWGFAPEDLTVPVDVWGGSDDELVPTHWPPALARRIPGATLNIRTGGHFMAHLHYREILGTLRRRSEG